ncbi:HD domain-containing protein [bacterium]|nr:HD domain-containing protein [candidate division CSSED10-310 bacterium]
MAKLTVLVDNRPAQVVRIKDVVTVGRDSNNEIQIIDVKVSRRHSVIEKRKGYHIVKDLGSRNGTFLNGVQVEESELKSGDRLRVGDTEILFEEEPALDVSEESNPVDIASDSSSVVKILDHTFEIKNLADLDVTKESTPKLREALAKLTTLFEVGNLINTCRDSTSLVDAIIDMITRVVKADRCYLLLNDERTGELAPVAVRTDEEGDPAPKISNTILNQVLEKGISILSPDAFQDERFQGSESIFIHSIRSAMCVPLRCRDKIIGIIHVDTKGVFETFAEDDLKMLTAIGVSAGIALENMRLYEDLKRLFRSTVKSLVATIEANDPYTGGHSIRVAEYSKQIALTMGLPDDDVEQVELAAFLHDVGKVGIPDSILNKPGAFNNEEKNIMHAHPATGSEILMKIDGMETISRIVRYHHEHFNGKGYPDGLKGSEIPLGSRILCVADTLDAITTDRAYRSKKSIVEALMEIERCAGSQFDPEIVKILKKCVSSSAIKK